MLDIEEIKLAVPRQHRSKITPEFIDTLGKFVDDPDFGEFYGKNIISYSSVLQDGKFKINDYFNAVAFVSHKMLGCSNLAAYHKVFPDKVKRLLGKNISDKDLHTYAAVYNKGLLVTKITEQTLYPDHIVYASIRHKAIHTQANLLEHPNPHIAQKAADSLMTHLKTPEKSTMQLEIGTKDGGIIADLASALSNLSNAQRGLIIDGSSNAQDIAHSPLLVTKVEDTD